MKQTKLALCVVDVNKATGRVTVHSPSGSSVELYPLHLTIALATRIAEASVSRGAAKVGMNRVVPMVFSYAELAAIKVASMRTAEDDAMAQAFEEDENPYWDIAAERALACDEITC